MTKIDQTTEKTKLHYLQDGALYMLWKYLNARRLVWKNILTFWDITPADIDVVVAAKIFLKALSIVDIPLYDSTFHKGACMKALEQNSYTVGTLAESKGLKSTDGLEVIKHDIFSFQDFEKYSLLYSSTSMLNFFEFKPELRKPVRNKLTDFIDLYIEDFIADKLEIERENFYRFDRQKSELTNLLRQKEDDYGNQFIVEFNTQKDVFGFDTSASDYLFIHTLIALERLRYFTVQDIWVIDPDTPINEQQRDYYKIKFVLGDRFYEEVVPQAKISRETSFDAVNSVLNLNKKRIEVSKTKNSDPHYLLTILFRDKQKVWAYDEVWNDPFFRLPGKEYDPREDWRKIYNAGYSVNEKVAKATTINDFLGITKTEISITKKYLS